MIYTSYDLSQVVVVYLLCSKFCTQVIHANDAHHFQCDVKVLIEELHSFDKHVYYGQWSMSIAQCIYLLVIHFLTSFLLFFFFFFSDFKIFFIYCVFKPLFWRTKMYWNHVFSYCFLSVTVKIQFQNLFNMPHG